MIVCDPSVIRVGRTWSHTILSGSGQVNQTGFPVLTNVLRIIADFIGNAQERIADSRDEAAAGVVLQEFCRNISAVSKSNDILIFPTRKILSVHFHMFLYFQTKPGINEALLDLWLGLNGDMILQQFIKETTG